MSWRKLFSTLTRLRQNHTSLTSFIDHASASNLDTASTVYKGTLYEYTVLESLQSHAFKLYRTGGADDKGIDLRGTWQLPGNHLDVVVQCKNEAKKIGPKYIRELGGICPPTGTLLVMASASTYTEKAIQALMASDSPVVLTVVSDFEQGGILRQVIWNTVAGKLLDALSVRLVHKEEDTVLKLFYSNKLLKKVRV